MLRKRIQQGFVSFVRLVKKEKSRNSFVMPIIVIPSHMRGIFLPFSFPRDVISWISSSLICLLTGCLSAGLLDFSMEHRFLETCQPCDRVGGIT